MDGEEEEELVAREINYEVGGKRERGEEINFLFGSLLLSPL